MRTVVEGTQGAQHHTVGHRRARGLARGRPLVEADCPRPCDRRQMRVSAATDASRRSVPERASVRSRMDGLAAPVNSSAHLVTPTQGASALNLYL
jgi:hypothetical protein